MDLLEKKKPFWECISITTAALMTTSFLAGIVIGRKLNNTFQRVLSVASVGPTKLALVVREDLKMGKGKIAAQCCHGTITAYKQMQKSNPRVLQAWESVGQPKVVLRASDLDHLNRLMEMAAAEKVPIALVQDAGRTQVIKGSQTVLAVGPANVTEIDKITGSLKLL